MPKVSKYGETWNSDDPVAIELSCIKRWGKWIGLSGKECGEGLFHHVKAFQSLVWPDKMWHRWNEGLILPELCRGGTLAIFGGASCVHGDTRIDDPVRGTRRTIRELCESGEAPFVMTLTGPVKSSVPFLKGIAPLFEVVLENGNRFVATAKHRVMMPNGRYVRVDQLSPGSSLLGFSPFQPPSTSEPCPLVPFSNEGGSRKTIPNSQFGYPAYPYSYGEPLRFWKGTDQYVFPSPTDAPGRSRYTWRSDGLSSKSIHIHPCQYSDRLSTLNTAAPVSSMETRGLPRSSVKICGHGKSLFPLVSQSSLKTNRIHTSPKPNPGAYRKFRIQESSRAVSFPSSKYMVPLTKVASIKPVGRHKFYDLCVPNVHHYFAEGAIHHNSGKTHEVADFMLTLYWAFPNDFTGLCSTTTIPQLNLRIWGQIKKQFRAAKKLFPWLAGHLIDSSRQISTDGKEVEGREFRNGILGVPCKTSQNEWVGLQDYAGLKNNIVMLASDEAHLMPSGFLQGAANLKSNRGRNDNEGFRACYTGNLTDLSTPLGEAAEPELGWDALIDSEISRVYKTRYMNGRAIQLVGKDSPNFDFPEGKEPYRKLIGRKYMEEMAHDYGEGTPMYNIMAGGKIPRGTMENRVITRQLCLQFNAFEPVVWGHDPLTKLYCSDLSYTADHGDRTCGMPMAFGRDNENKMKLAPLERPLIYTPSDRKTGSIEEQLARQMRGECERLGIPPSHVFFDGTGRSSFTSAIMRLWSTEVNAIEFGGNATERPNFMGRKYREGKEEGDIMPCSEVFGKMVTELWFATRYVIEYDQCRGMFDEIVKEGVMRLWVINKANKTDVEPKKEMKMRLGRSPDLYDMFAVGCEGARRLGFVIGKPNPPKPRNTHWFRNLREKMDDGWKKQELVYN